MKTSKNYFPVPIIPVQCRWWAEPNPSSSGSTKQGPSDVHTHTRSDWDNSETPTHQTCPPLGCERKPKYLEKNPRRYGENVQTAHKQWAGEESIFFSLTLQGIAIEYNHVMRGPAVRVCLNIRWAKLGLHL